MRSVHTRRTPISAPACRHIDVYQQSTEAARTCGKLHVIADQMYLCTAVHVISRSTVPWGSSCRVKFSGGLRRIISALPLFHHGKATDVYPSYDILTVAKRRRCRFSLERSVCIHCCSRSKAQSQMQFSNRTLPISVETFSFAYGPRGTRISAAKLVQGYANSGPVLQIAANQTDWNLGCIVLGCVIVGFLSAPPINCGAPAA